VLPRNRQLQPAFFLEIFLSRGYESWKSISGTETHAGIPEKGWDDLQVLSLGKKEMQEE